MTVIKAQKNIQKLESSERTGCASQVQEEKIRFPLKVRAKIKEMIDGDRRLINQESRKSEPICIFLCIFFSLYIITGDAGVL